MYQIFAQTAYGEGIYGSSTYNGTTATTVTGGDGGLIDTGSPVFWGGFVGLSLTLAVIMTVIASSRRKKLYSSR